MPWHFPMNPLKKLPVALDRLEQFFQCNQINQCDQWSRHFHFPNQPFLSPTTSLYKYHPNWKFFAAMKAFLALDPPMDW
jgi:hypothetical protein